ncbi:MAG TPA: response regulator [Chthonomonadaceae bacterium]|nr:response regulator [Chthonomonadaceae bacterium]
MPQSYAQAANGQATQNPQPVDGEPIDLKGKRVVVVEDEGITQMQLRRILMRAGIILAGAAFNGQEGVAVTLREHPDIVLMDIRMPMMNGLEATRRILEAAPMCVIMMTGFADLEYQEQAEQIGASGYIQKPLTADTLLPQMEAAYRRFLDRQTGGPSSP